MYSKVRGVESHGYWPGGFPLKSWTDYQFKGTERKNKKRGYDYFLCKLTWSKYNDYCELIGREDAVAFQWNVSACVIYVKTNITPNVLLIL